MNEDHFRTDKEINLIFKRLLERNTAYEFNKLRREYPKVKPDFSGLFLFDLDMENINLSGAILRGTEFSHCRLFGASFSVPI